MNEMDGVYRVDGPHLADIYEVRNKHSNEVITKCDHNAVTDLELQLRVKLMRNPHFVCFGETPADNADIKT